MPDPVMGERACVFVTLKQGEQLTFDEMTDYLKSKKIAMFKLPEKLEVVEALPLVGECGKIDKKALAKWIADKVSE
jgi:non-ribosomal peptide synthetase component E (peptide arylation enzyme)